MANLISAVLALQLLCASDASREKARAALRIHCGACHDPDPVPARPRALRVYDLSEPDWSARMTDRQLRAIVARLEGRGEMTAAERAESVPKGSPTPPRPAPADIAAIRKFVAEELHARATRRR